MADTDDGDFEAVSAMADRLQLKGRERGKYIDRHMTGLGYRMQPTYVVAEDDDDDDGEDDRFFGGRSRRGGGRSRDDDDDRPRRTRRESGGRDSWYD